ncbi:helix-turn-helix transcriptional regulator [Oscillospiraceae bacterium 50-16]
MTTGQLIKAARKKAGMTQTELAQKLNIPFQSISQWERDIRKPKMDNLQKMADYFGVSVNSLIPPPKYPPFPDNLAKIFLNGNIGSNIMNLRRAKGLSQKKLSERTGIPLKYLISFESESGGYFPTEDDLLRLADVFRVDPKYIKGTGIIQEELLSTPQENLTGVSEDAWPRAEQQIRDTSSPSVLGESLTAPMQRAVDAMEELNTEGQERVADYAEDLEASGRYKKHRSSGLDKREA